MPIDKKKIKEQLDKEKEELVAQLRDIGKLDPKTNSWEPVPEDLGYVEADQNDIADRFEDFESRSSMLKILEKRLNNILEVLKKINKKSFGRCSVCDKKIELDRMKANPAASTCKKHLEK
jgi:RNA polymerase-binding transcription factor DksA